MRLACLAALLAAPVLLAQSPRPQVPGAIRSRVVLVPVDVRVIDQRGDPVADLRQSDFTIEEDGIVQAIAHFSLQAYSARDPATEAGPPPLRRGPGLESTPSTYRTFVILLGRGRLQGPSKGLDAVIEFVRAGLLPQDRVAVLAYGRATDLTTDRAAIVRLLERYRERHTHIEALLDQFFDPSGLAWMFQVDHPPHIKPAIDALYSVPGLPAVRHIAALAPPGVGEFERDRLRILDAFDRDDREPGGGFVTDQAARDDLEKLHGSVEYLRHLEGEKHLIFLTEEGMHHLTRDQADHLAAMASDARVTISPIHTSGVSTTWTREGRNRVVFNGPSWHQRWANADLRIIASLTGGQVSIYTYASQAIGRLERATRAYYVLGYYPVDARWDGGERRITVRVGRPGVTVQHRRSYYAREDLVPFDRREFLTSTRIAAGAAYRQFVADLGVSVSASRIEKRQHPWQVHVQVVVNPATIRFVEVDGKQTASIDVAVFIGNRAQRLVGEVKKRVDLRLEPESHARLMRDGVSFSATVDATAEVRHVKAVVYDYGTDRLGTAITQLK
jgi:VWFA-related protein